MANSEMEVGLDKEGLEVLNELEKEGFEIKGREKPEVTPEVKPEEKPAEIKPEVKPEAKPEVKPEVKPDAKPDNQNPAPDRKVQHVPLPKYLETEKQLKEANAKIEELTKAGAKPSAESVAEAVDAVKLLTEKYGYDEDEAKKLADVIKAIVPNQALSAEQQKAIADVNALRESLTKQQESLKDEQDKIAFNNDFTESVLKSFPHLANYKDQIKEMAYTEEYAKTPLRAIALAFMDAEGIAQKPVDVRTAENGGNASGGQGGDTINFDSLTDEQFSKLSTEEQDKFFAYQEEKERTARGALKPNR